MANYIPRGARRVLDSDTTRAIAATAVGEVIRRAGTTRNKAAEAASDARVPAAGGFAVGAGAATIALVAGKRIARFITKPKRPAVLDQPVAKVASGARKTAQAPRDAVDAFTSKLGSGSSGARRTSSGPSRSTPKRASTKRAGGSSGQGSRAKAARSTAASGRTQRTKSAQTKARPKTAPSRGSSAKRSGSSNRSSATATTKSARSSNGSGATSSAKRTRSANGSSKSPSAKSSRSSNGSRATKTNGKSATRPEASRRS